MRIDLHTHSAISDGTDTPSGLIDRAKQVGLDVVALTDHDTFAGLDEAVGRGKRVGIEVVRGMELSCSRRGQSVHLLAYGADPAFPALAAEMAKVRGGRMGRLAGVLHRLAALGVPVTEEQVLAEVGESPSVGRPHIADAMVKAGHVADRTEAFDRFLADGGPAHVPRYAIPVERGVDLVHDAGGVAVIAHPWGRGREHILPREVLGRLTDERGWTGSRLTIRTTTRIPAPGCVLWPASWACWRPARATTTAPASLTTSWAVTPPTQRCSTR